MASESGAEHEVPLTMTESKPEDAERVIRKTLEAHVKAQAARNEARKRYERAVRT